MKFICDEMLKGLARWLRLAGYDVLVEPDGTADRNLIERALNEERRLLTRDRRLLEIRNAGSVVTVLLGNDLESLACEVGSKLGVNWLLRPFSRCSLCNTPLVAAEQRAPDLPADIDQLFICPACGQYYWQGGHVARMRKRLERWNGNSSVDAQTRE